MHCFPFPPLCTFLLLYGLLQCYTALSLLISSGEPNPVASQVLLGTDSLSHRLAPGAHSAFQKQVLGC